MTHEDKIFNHLILLRERNGDYHDHKENIVYIGLALAVALSGEAIRSGGQELSYRLTIVAASVALTIFIRKQMSLRWGARKMISAIDMSLRELAVKDIDSLNTKPRYVKLMKKYEEPFYRKIIRPRNLELNALHFRSYDFVCKKIEDVQKNYIQNDKFSKNTDTLLSLTLCIFPVLYLSGKYLYRLSMCL